MRLLTEGLLALIAIIMIIIVKIIAGIIIAVSPVPIARPRIRTCLPRCLPLTLLHVETALRP